MDDSNVTPNGEDLETPTGSQPGTTTTEPTEDVNLEGASASSPEEVAWNSLKGNTQDRIKSILHERDEERAKSERLDSFIRSQGSFQQPTTPTNPEVQSAVQKLSDVGIATKDEVRKEINQVIGQLVYNSTLEKLEGKYDGSGGLPKFDRTEYQDFVNRNQKYQNYDPEDVYQKMYEEELLDAKMKAYKGNGGQSTTTSLRPNKTTVREEQWSGEWLENRMKQADGLDWYAKNRDKVNNWLSTQAPE